MRLKGTIIVLFVCLLFFASHFSVLASTITVSPGQTIQSMADVANPGDIISVSAGTYNEVVSVSRPGITFKANGLVNIKGFYITGDNTTVSGFTMNDIPGYGIDVRSNNSIFKDNIIIKARNACIFVAGQNNLIENNECSYTIQPTSNGGDADCFRFFGGGHTFRGNYCHDIPTDGVLVRNAHTDCFQTWNWTSVGGVGHDILFEKNSCILPFKGPEFSAKIWQAEEGPYNLMIKNNLAVAGGFISLIIDGKNISFINNTLIGAGEGSDGLHLSNTTVNIHNNIFAHQRQRVIQKMDSNVNITASNNCYIDYGIMLPANPGDVRSTDALFVNEASGDYHLQQNSPCLGMGAYENINETPKKTGDINSDGLVNIIDIGIVIDNYGSSPPTDPRADLDKNSTINIIDIGIIVDNYYE